MNFNTLTLTLNNFISVFSAGYGRLSGPASSLLAILIAIEVVLTGFWVALGGGDQLAHLFKKILYIGTWVWIVRSFPALAKTFVDSLIQAGLLAGGRGGSYDLLMDPSRIAGYGLDATAPLIKKISDLSITDLSEIVVYGAAFVAIVASYFILAINVFVAVLEYYLVLALVGVFMPFGVLPSTKFLAEKAIGAVVSAGMKLMVLSLIIAVIEPVVSKIAFSGDDIAMNELLSVVLTSGACAFLAWHAPRFASGLMSGSPSLGVGEAFQSASTAAAAGAAIASSGASVLATRSAAALPASTPMRPSGGGALGGAMPASSARAATMPGSLAGAQPANSNAGETVAAASDLRASPTLVKSVMRSPNAGSSSAPAVPTSTVRRILPPPTQPVPETAPALA
jgi:type IV secretion system protein TrbL